MTHLTIHFSILDAEDEDFTPSFRDHEIYSSIPCLDLHFQSGIVELVYSQVARPFVVTEEMVRFDACGPLSATRLQESLLPGGDLLQLLEEARHAASTDAGLLAACERVNAYLAGLTTE